MQARALAWWWVALTCAVLVVGSSRAQAQTEPDPHDAEARQLFEAGRMAFDDARYEDALTRFREALRMSGRAALYYNIGQCLDRLRRDAEAVDAFEHYIAELPTAANRHEVEERLTILRTAMARGTTAPPETPSVAPVVEPPPPASTVPPQATLADATPTQHETPIYEEWWLWTLIGVAVAAAVVVPIAVVETSGGSGVQDPIRGDYGPSGVIITLTSP